MKTLIIILLTFSTSQIFAWEEKPAYFVDVKKEIPTVSIEMRYATYYNFMGKIIPGYTSNKCYLHNAVVKKLKQVQKDLNSKGLSLKIYDCYRPQQAVDTFYKWAMNDSKATHKLSFHPNISKSTLFKNNYLAKKSKHSKGIAVDLTIIKIKNSPSIIFYDSPQKDCTKSSKWPKGENSIEMGTTFDCLDPLSNTESPYISTEALTNRRLLKKYMSKHGFRNYSKEWWHYTLPSVKVTKYYNFEIK